MATHTTVAAYRAAVFAAMQADVTLGAVQVSYGEPADAKREEAVWLGNAVDLGSSEDPYIASGRRKRHEEYEVQVTVDVASQRTAPASELRAAVLVGALEDLLAVDSTLSVDGVLWGVPASFEWETDLSGDGGTPRTVVTFDITVKGHLS